MVTEQRLFRGLALVFLTAACAGPGDRREAQAGGAPAPPQALDSATAGVWSPSESAGVFIGVDSFADPTVSRLPDAVNDAVNLAHTLSVEHGLLPLRRVSLLLSGEPVGAAIEKRETMRGEALIAPATKARIEAALQERAKLVGPHGILYVFVATHGYSDGSTQFLMAADSLADAPDSVLDVERLLEATQIAAGGQILLILDTCRVKIAAGGGVKQGTATSRGAQTVQPDRRRGTMARIVNRRPGLAVLFATRQGAVAMSDPDRWTGVLSGAIRDGLRCGNATAKPSAVSLFGLAPIVQDLVTERSGGRQTAELLTSHGFRDFVMMRCGPLCELLAPRENETVALGNGDVEVRCHAAGLYVTAVIFAERSVVYFHQPQTLPAPPEKVVRLPVTYGGVDDFQVYVGVTSDPELLIGEIQIPRLPAGDSLGRPVLWLDPVHVTAAGVNR